MIYVSVNLESCKKIKNSRKSSKPWQKIKIMKMWQNQSLKPCNGVLTSRKANSTKRKKRKPTVPDDHAVARLVKII